MTGSVSCRINQLTPEKLTHSGIKQRKCDVQIINLRQKCNNYKDENKVDKPVFELVWRQKRAVQTEIRPPERRT